MVTTDHSTTDTCAALQKLQAHLEALYDDLQRQAEHKRAEGEPLASFGAGCRAHGVDMALRQVDAALIKLQQGVRP